MRALPDYVTRKPRSGSRVVITGMGAVAPNGIGREAFWQAVKSGRSGVRRITRFDVSSYPTQIAAEVVDFDPRTVLPDRDVRHVPRVTAMALAAATEALRDATLDPRALTLEDRQAFACVVGSGSAGLEFAEAQFRQYYLLDSKGVSLYTIPSATPGSISSEISMRFDLRGPSHVITTGCTSSTDALGRALDFIRCGRAERVLVGGADATVGPAILRGFCLLRVMTTRWNHDPPRGSRPFSADRDGFVLGEGAWFFVLETAEAARARGARIYAELAGYGATCEAFHRVRLAESGEEPARAMALALADAGLRAEDVDYIAMHGTSTVLNDRIETRALRRLFGARASGIPGSSVKSMIGHPQGASGAAGLATALLAMRDSYLPPTINVEIPDPECDLDVVPNVGRRKEVRVALCNCLGFGSKNSALVVRQLDDTALPG